MGKINLLSVVLIIITLFFSCKENTNNKSTEKEILISNKTKSLLTIVNTNEKVYENDFIKIHYTIETKKRDSVYLKLKPNKNSSDVKMYDKNKKEISVLKSKKGSSFLYLKSSNIGKNEISFLCHFLNEKIYREYQISFNVLKYK